MPPCHLLSIYLYCNVGHRARVNAPVSDDQAAAAALIRPLADRRHSGAPTCSVGSEGALTPRQGVLEGVEEVPHDPGHDGVVVHAHQERRQP